MRALLAVSLFWAFSGAALAEVTVSDAWVAEGPPAAAVLGGYMQLHNGGAAAVTLTAVVSPAFARVELHRSVHMDGMARMQPQERILIQPGATLALQPGSYHLMLIEPKRALAAGDSVDLGLRFDDGQTLQLSAPVRKLTATMQGMKH